MYYCLSLFVIICLHDLISSGWKRGDVNDPCERNAKFDFSKKVEITSHFLPVQVLNKLQMSVATVVPLCFGRSCKG